MSARLTPSQTAGPYFAYGLVPQQYGYPHGDIASAQVGGEDTNGERIRVEGQVLDGNGDAVHDAMIEIWQADAQGRYAHPADPRRPNTGFTGFARVGTGTDPSHRYWFDTIKPGAIDAQQAPYINVIVFMRGLLTHVCTRIYFSDEKIANDADPVLAAVPPRRRGTLMAQRQETPDGVLYRFDVHMQGALETVFFDF